MIGKTLGMPSLAVALHPTSHEKTLAEGGTRRQHRHTQGFPNREHFQFWTLPCDLVSAFRTPWVWPDFRLVALRLITWSLCLLKWQCRHTQGFPNWEHYESRTPLSGLIPLLEHTRYDQIFRLIIWKFGHAQGVLKWKSITWRSLKLFSSIWKTLGMVKFGKFGHAQSVLKRKLITWQSSKSFSSIGKTRGQVDIGQSGSPSIRLSVWRVQLGTAKHGKFCMAWSGSFRTQKNIHTDSDRWEDAKNAHPKFLPRLLGGSQIFWCKNQNFPGRYQRLGIEHGLKRHHSRCRDSPVRLLGAYSECKALCFRCLAPSYRSTDALWSWIQSVTAQKNRIRHRYQTLWASSSLLFSIPLSSCSASMSCLTGHRSGEPQGQPAPGKAPRHPSHPRHWFLQYLWDHHCPHLQYRPVWHCQIWHMLHESPRLYLHHQMDWVHESGQRGQGKLGYWCIAWSQRCCSFIFVFVHLVLPSPNLFLSGPKHCHLDSCCAIKLGSWKGAISAFFHIFSDLFRGVVESLGWNLQFWVWAKSAHWYLH